MIAKFSNKNAGHLTKFKFQISCFLDITMTHAMFVKYLY